MLSPPPIRDRVHEGLVWDMREAMRRGVTEKRVLHCTLRINLPQKIAHCLDRQPAGNDEVGGMNLGRVFLFVTGLL